MAKVDACGGGKTYVGELMLFYSKGCQNLWWSNNKNYQGRESVICDLYVEGISERVASIILHVSGLINNVLFFNIRCVNF